MKRNSGRTGVIVVSDRDWAICGNERFAGNITLKDELKLRLDKLEGHDALLNSRERHVLTMILNGRLNKSMARELQVTERTIENMRARMMKKFGVTSLAELIVAAAELRLLRTIVSDDGTSVHRIDVPSENRNASDVFTDRKEC